MVRALTIWAIWAEIGPARIKSRGLDRLISRIMAPRSIITRNRIGKSRLRPAARNHRIILRTTRPAALEIGPVRWRNRRHRPDRHPRIAPNTSREIEVRGNAPYRPGQGHVRCPDWGLAPATSGGVEGPGRFPATPTPPLRHRLYYREGRHPAPRKHGVRTRNPLGESPPFLLGLPPVNIG